MFRVGGIGEGIHDFFVARESAGVFQRPAADPVEQQRRRHGRFDGTGAHQLKPVKPAVPEVILVECFTGAQYGQLIQGAVLLRPVSRFLTIVRGEPLREFRHVARIEYLIEKQAARIDVKLNAGDPDRSLFDLAAYDPSSPAHDEVLGIFVIWSRYFGSASVAEGLRCD